MRAMNSRSLSPPKSTCFAHIPYSVFLNFQKSLWIVRITVGTGSVYESIKWEHLRNVRVRNCSSVKIPSQDNSGIWELISYWHLVIRESKTMLNAYYSKYVLQNVLQATFRLVVPIYKLCIVTMATFSLVCMTFGNLPDFSAILKSRQVCVPKLSYGSIRIQ